MLSSARGSLSSYKIKGILAVLMFWNAIQARDFFVSPQGDDMNSGHLEAPFKTIVKAQLVVRELIEKGLTESVVVNIRAGRYELSQTLNFGMKDSGNEKYSITYCAYKDEKPLFSFGRQIEGFKQQKDSTWQVLLPEVKAGKWYFEQLFVNGKRALRARTPNENYHLMKGVTQTILSDAKQRVADKATQLIQVDSDLVSSLAHLSAAELNDVTMTIYHKWDVTIRKLQRIDSTNQTLLLSGKAMKTWNNWKEGQRFHLENYAQALDQAGEWFLSKDGLLTYRPLENEKIGETEVIAPYVENFIVIQGDDKKNMKIKNLIFINLSFSHSNAVLPQNGFEANQAASTVEAAVMVDHAEGIVFENCEFSNLGKYGIWLRQGCQNNVVEHCYIHDLGAGGVKIGEGGSQSDPTLQTHHNRIENNIIRSGGHIYACAVGVWLGLTAHNQVLHNEIADFKYTGVSLGWKWDYGKTNAHDNHIDFNHIHHLGWGVLSDLGGIYNLGDATGSTANNNRIHDILSYTYGGWGLYTDQGSTGLEMKNNYVYHTKSGGFHQHYGMLNTVRNNIFVDSFEQQFQFTRVEAHLSFSFFNNIVLYEQGPIFRGPWLKGQIEMRNNVYWGIKSTPSFFDMDLNQWQAKGKDIGSQIADIIAIDPSTMEVSYKNELVLKEKGIVPFDPNQAGVYGDAKWRSLSREVVYPSFKEMASRVSK